VTNTEGRAHTPPSAYTDRQYAPGALSIVCIDGQETSFFAPTLVSFDQALRVIHSKRDRTDFCLVALDQPTIVPNLTGMKPVDRVAASIISWAGGGVQPANRSKIGMLDDSAPLWRFKESLGAVEQPEDIRTATIGLFLIEVFPALASLSLDEQFHCRLEATRYNPARARSS
jgi:predicted RNase H-like nuclease